ncbi:MAG: hypothetical protein II251_05995 [Lachnospiraceae bacterium]|nr:hypothetical protein [Lachnospiraceae bacterium]
MKCKICNHEMNPGIAKCPKCGFPVLQMVKGDAAEEKRMNELADNFRKKKMEPVRIQMTVYTNAMENDKVKVVKEDKILLAQGDQLAGNQIIWYPENFARLSGDCKLKLSLVHTNGDLEDMNISVANPNIMDFWNIGIMPLEGLEFKVVLGNKNTYSCSDKFSYL